MYAIHTTEGFVIGSAPYGEAGKIVSLLTRDFGLVSAVAQGIRLERSKLRYHVQDLSFGSFSLVRGKEFWRLTSASPSAAPARPPHPAGRALLARVAALLRRLLHGEGADPGLFECVDACARTLAAGGIGADGRLETLESVTVSRILRALGYIAAGPDAGAEPAGLGPADLDRLSAKRAEMNREINRALKASHL
ncbi:MAG: DNA repair protein RecO [Patescibacteria group bacterium]|nr:DNA repair protein RecO [Patescibacteria group bacterium]